MSDRIEIFGIEGFGFHGVFDHERKDGQIFRVDVALELDLSKAVMSDDLSDTVDYGAVSNLVEAHITGTPFALIEKLAGTIATSLMFQFPQLQKVNVTVHKPQAPIAVKFQDVAVTVKRTR
jgi:dihydroneopterin aldolase